MLLRTWLVCCLAAAVLLTGFFAHSAAQQPAQALGTSCEKTCKECACAKGNSESAGRLMQRTYAVGDLIVPFDAVRAGPGVITPTTEASLIHMIVNTVNPQSWSSVGGPGTIDFFPPDMTLVVNQTAEVHERISNLLSALRRLQDLQVTVEVRVVSVRDANLAKKVCDTMKQGKGATSAGFCFLNSDQARQLLEHVQKDRDSNVMMAPKLAMFNGQVGQMSILENHAFQLVTAPDGKRPTCRPENQAVSAGWQICVQPTITADRRFVRVHLEVNQTCVDQPKPSILATAAQKSEGSDADSNCCTSASASPHVTKRTLEKTLVVPDGGTALMMGWTTAVNACCASNPPILTKIPYVENLFKNQAGETTLVLVTPRIIVNEEAEVAQALPPPLPAPIPALVKQARTDGSKPSCCTPPSATGVMTIMLPAGAADGSKSSCCSGSACKASCSCTTNVLPSGPVTSATVAVCPPPAPSYETASARAYQAAPLSSAMPTPPAPANPDPTAKTAAQLRQMYRQACADGQPDLARKLAAFALELDANCFNR